MDVVISKSDNKNKKMKSIKQGKNFYWNKWRKYIYIIKIRTHSKMTDYSKSKIYFITNSIDETIYVGSTTQSLQKRLNNHFHNCNKRAGKINKLHEHMNKHGTLAFSISLLEDYPCKSKSDLELKEAEYIKKQVSVLQK